MALAHRLGYVAELSGVERDRRVRGRLAIPYVLPAGVVNIKYRVLNDELSEPKYLSVGGGMHELYQTVDEHGVCALLQSSDVIAVTEGEVDAITLQQCGIPAVSVANGADAWNAELYPLVFQSYRRVLVCQDGDTAGERFANKVLESVRTAEVVEFPDKSDVNHYFNERGRDALIARFAA